MRIDLWIPTANPMTTPELLALIGAEAEQRGVGTIWVGEHVVLFDEYASSYPYSEDGRIPAPPGTGLLEPLATLSFLAAHTTTVRLGTAMLLLPQRNPVYTAKEVSTLDWLSNGRVDLGVGVGWLEEEFNAVNVSVAPTGQADRRVPRGAEDALVRRDLRLRRGVLLAQSLRHVPQAGAAATSADPHRRGERCRPGPGGPGRPGVAHLQPDARSARRAARETGSIARPIRVGSATT